MYSSISTYRIDPYQGLLQKNNNKAIYKYHEAMPKSIRRQLLSNKFPLRQMEQ